MNGQQSDLERDFIHRIPTPLPIDRDEPFVGNETVDDNLVESAQVALWKATGGHRQSIGVRVANGVVSLGGSVDSAEEARRCEESVRAVPGVRNVISELHWRGGPGDGHEQRIARRRGRRALYAARFCQLTTASVEAAIRDAIASLRVLRSDEQSAVDAVVVYSNSQPQTITVEVGIPVSQAISNAAGADLKIGLMPLGGGLSVALAKPGVQGLLEAFASLLHQASASELAVASYFWQPVSLTADGFASTPTIHLPLEPRSRAKK